MTTLDDVIEALTALRATAKAGGSTPVRLASNDSDGRFAHSLGTIAISAEPADDEVVYIGEAGCLGHLPRAAVEALGWE